MMLSLGIMGVLTDRRIKGKQQRGEEVKPEDRIPIHIVLSGALCLPAGLFIYGWAVQYDVHWIVAMVSELPTELSFVAATSPSETIQSSLSHILLFL